MKNTRLKLIYFLFFLLLNQFANAQAKKPIIMVVPSDNWCIEHGYVIQFDDQGTKKTIPDYKRAVQESSDLLIVISKINTLMNDRGFPLKNLESAIKSLESESAEDEMTKSSKGATISESPIDKLKKVAKADIWIQITWKLNTSGPKKSVTFIMQGLDAYSDKQIAGDQGTSSQSFSEWPILLEEAVLAHLDNFNVQLQSHFDDMFTNGREIVLRIKKWETSDIDLEKEYGDKSLTDIIEDWVKENTVQNRFGSPDVGDNFIKFEQVRIPANIDARGWTRGLQKYLKTTYQIESKIMVKGLGQATLILGEK